ncbi:DNA-processing protein DprA [Chryseobacterium indologenes]|uniref:DNA-protecting protein DprA n=1 Tax=Chryseobacterium oryzae TaxID=2929799 RepID=A0ABY4BGU7_9FLAO|nr:MULTISPECIES: DNA-processing protein DprA [Chryseobacterium]AYZ35169.1 DNA-processing protein DprA [Chryseobacterium indologenes]MEB4762897.1 DNA-protecting protein DprA [Chryseobacterium indologenes]UEQ78084.1 DNA-protecting protein DprA [Chryseobacterium arthrosphaerae]UOE37487.1 DNA-protecting protein DprA [Chryseobacterium oryzae]VXC32295.1 DNA-binding protein [Chryseobacterium sp. 8AT]
MEKVQEYLNQLTAIERKNSPETFYYQGDFSLLETGRRVAVVGSRKVSDLGVKRVGLIVKKLVQNNITVVSGLAEGVDTAAHSSAIKYGGNTISVIGTSLDQYYPKKNKDLQDMIAKEHLLISQFPKSYPTTPKNFPMRNRTMALISDATIIVEATEKSGTMHQGWEALRLGRSLYILENIISEHNISWAKEMLQYGAEIITNDNIQDILDDLPFLTSKELYAI